MSERQEVTAYLAYQWDRDCGYVNVCESDPAGEDVECDDCGAECRVGKTL